MAFYTGVFNTTVNPAELNARSFAATMLRLYPDGSAPLFGLTSMTGRSTAKSSTHGYFTKTLAFGSVQINSAALNSGSTVFPVDSTVGMIPKMVIYNPTTRENIRIISVDSATQLTVTRAFGRVAAGAVADDQVLVVIGSAFEEGSARPVARGLTLVYIANYTQIFRNAWAVTDTARASATEMGFSNIAENRKDCSVLHSVEIESAIIFGQPKMDVTGSQPLHATQGIIDAVEQYAPGNTTVMGSTTTYAQLITAIEPAWTYSHNMGEAKSRMVIAGSTAMKVFNEIARLNGEVHYEQNQTKFGFSFTDFIFYKGRIVMVEHPLLNGIPGMSGLAIGLDMPALKLAYLEGRDTRPEEYGGTGRNNATGVDADGGSLTTEFAVELLNPAGFFVLYGLTAGAA